MGTVNRIVDFGAFVEIFPNVEGLLHISEISDRRVRDVRDELKEGQQIMVNVSARKAIKSNFPVKPCFRENKPKRKSD
jgi:polyribonucleotide nucleotidyltransferase